MSNDRTNPQEQSSPCKRYTNQPGGPPLRDFYDIDLRFVGKSTKPSSSRF